jgi:hypothetical protein
MSVMPRSMLAYQAGRWRRAYFTDDGRGRRNLQRTFIEPMESISRRLEADPDGRVSRALAKLIPESELPRAIRDAGQVLFWTVQAADLAMSANNISWHAQQEHEKYKDQAVAARELLTFCKGRVPLNLVMMFPPLIDFLEKEATRHKEAPAELQIKRTKRTANAEPTLALRNLGKRLREAGISRPDHGAVEYLIRVALNRVEPIPSHVVANALRVKMQVGKDIPPAQLTKQRNSLKNKASTKRPAR